MDFFYITRQEVIVNETFLCILSIRRKLKIYLSKTKMNVKLLPFENDVVFFTLLYFHER